MFRMWGKIFLKNHMLKDMTYCDDSDLNRTKKVFKGIEEMCNYFDLAQPMWLETNIKDFKRNSKTRFGKDSFIEQIEFDYLEIQVIEED